MSQDSPESILIISAISLYLFFNWYKDLKKSETSEANPDPFLPGATYSAKKLVIIAIIGSLLLLFLETAGEHLLGISAEQKEITVLFLLLMISASFVEEVIFRGYLFLGTKQQPAKLWGSILLFSLLFALLHEYIWVRDENLSFWEIHKGAWTLNLTTKGLFSTGFIFLNSLWFYTMRFHSLNTKNSLIPCIAAHLTKNLGVFVIKLAEGKVSGLF